MKVLIAGDFCPRYRVEKLINKDDFARVLSGVKSLTDKADYSIVNYECPVIKGDASPIQKQGPNLKSTVKGIEAVKWAGFNCVTLANNHLLDFGETGVHDTIEACEIFGLDYVGCGNNIFEAEAILHVNVNGQKLAVINCCEHEFCIATDESAGCNPLNPIKQYYAIQKAKQEADRVLVIVHGGHEHFQLPSFRMMETYRFFIDAGADAVVNHHQHCISGYEIYNNKPIFYGLGNFLFDNEYNHNGIWTEGLVVEIDFTSSIPSFNVYPISQCAENPSVILLPENSYDETIARINNQLGNPKELKKAIDAFYSEGLSLYTDIFEPCGNRYYFGALRRGWIKSKISTSRFLSASNYISCESHRDRLLWWLNKGKN